MRISISLTCVLVSLQWATDGSPLLSESKKRNIRVKGKQSKEKAERWGGVGGSAEACGQLRHLTSVQLM